MIRLVLIERFCGILSWRYKLLQERAYIIMHPTVVGHESNDLGGAWHIWPPLSVPLQYKEGGAS